MLLKFSIEVWDLFLEVSSSSYYTNCFLRDIAWWFPLGSKCANGLLSGCTAVFKDLCLQEKQMDCKLLTENMQASGINTHSECCEFLCEICSIYQKIYNTVILVVRRMLHLHQRSVSLRFKKKCLSVILFDWMNSQLRIQIYCFWSWSRTSQVVISKHAQNKGWTLYSKTLE